MTQTPVILRGVLGGAAGSACMTVLRMAARRARLIDTTPPQATRRWLAQRLGREPDTPGTRHVIDALIHVGVGVVGGAVYGALIADRRQPGLVAGALFGLGVWVAAFGVAAPRLGITRSPREVSGVENAVNAAAHLIYGAATALVAGELAEQEHGHGAALRHWRDRTG